MNQHSRLPILAAAVLIGLGALATSPAAAMTLTTSPDPPVGSDILLAVDDPGATAGYLCSHGTGTTLDLGQSFTFPVPVILERVTLKVRPITAVGGDVVTLSFGTFTDAADASMNELLLLAMATLPRSLTVGEITYLTIDLAAEDLILKANRTYGVVLGFAGGGHVNDSRMELVHMGTDAYGAGQAVRRLAAATWESLPSDLVFYLHGRPGDERSLALHGGRFQVEVEWEKPGGEVGFAVPVQMSDSSGFFWFWNANNLELLVKVHDACVDPFQRFWVFAAGMTNVGVRMRVVDTLTGETWAYDNPVGTPFPPIQDTDAFATCDW